MFNHAAHRMGDNDDGFDKKGNKVNNNGGDTTDYLYDDSGKIVETKKVNIIENSGSELTFRFYGTKVVGQGGTLYDPSAEIFLNYAGGELLQGLKFGVQGIKWGGKLLEIGIKSRFFRKYIFNVSTTNQGGKVVSILNTFKYVGTRGSTFGDKLGYTRSLKIRWFGKDFHFLDW